MDQCKHCIVRGDVAACEQTDCNKHEYWYTQSLRARVAKLENGLKSILAVRKTAQAMEMPETWSIAATQMESIARRALEER